MHDEGTGSELISQAAVAYTARRVNPEAMRCIVAEGTPRAGDLVLAMVTERGHHKRLHLTNGAKKNLFPGDLVIVAYAARYAPNQFEALVPKDLRDCDLVAAGGVAGTVVEKHARIRRGPTRLRPIGLIASDSEAPPLNVGGFGLSPNPRGDARIIPTIAVVGTTMDSGKTTTAAHLVRGLRRYGMSVGYAKVTGTGAAGDPSLLRDAGAHPVLDFTDAGYASTYRLPHAVIASIFSELIGHVASEDVDAIVLEVADGLLQSETAELLESPVFRERVHGLIFAAGESMGALAGCQWLRDRDVPLRALAGCITRAPLHVREASSCGVPILTLGDLEDPATAAKLLKGTRM